MSVFPAVIGSWTEARRLLARWTIEQSHHVEAESRFGEIAALIVYRISERNPVRNAVEPLRVVEPRTDSIRASIASPCAIDRERMTESFSS